MHARPAAHLLPVALDHSVAPLDAQVGLRRRAQTARVGHRAPHVRTLVQHARLGGRAVEAGEQRAAHAKLGQRLGVGVGVGVGV
eukprot:CAMPEP_0119419902 /NCGR_PEP_ID=MMETSP1335-20130426/22062_1 /TAXON_ID=259385 /ORGANISM="Chrysoculter rhomboideus, Strain RCC1486" /LENGTH=83 /DNA_ID=CAMNT_0007445231 /DNA_START=232 /DNA_END=480 /DNA_ORIENTATION=+